MSNPNSISILLADRDLDGQTQPTVSGRDLHKFLGYARDFTTWAKQQVARGNFEEGKDFIRIFPNDVGRIRKGRPSVDYFFSLTAGKHIAMFSGTMKGVEVRDYFIDCERRVHSRGVPEMRDPTLAALVKGLIELDQVRHEVKQQQVVLEQQQTKMDQIEERIEVLDARSNTDQSYFTVVGFANLKRIHLDTPAASQVGRRCAQLSNAMGLPIGDVPDPRFGRVHSYHISVLEQVMAPGSDPLMLSH